MWPLKDVQKHYSVVHQKYVLYKSLLLALNLNIIYAVLRQITTWLYCYLTDCLRNKRFVHKKYVHVYVNRYIGYTENYLMSAQLGLLWLISVKKFLFSSAILSRGKIPSADSVTNFKKIIYSLSMNSSSPSLILLINTRPLNYSCSCYSIAQNQYGCLPFYF